MNEDSRSMCNSAKKIPIQSIKLCIYRMTLIGRSKSIAVSSSDTILVFGNGIMDGEGTSFCSLTRLIHPGSNLPETSSLVGPRKGHLADQRKLFRI